MRKHAFVLGVVATLLATAPVVAAPPVGTAPAAEPGLGSESMPPVFKPAAPLPSSRQNLPLNLPPCSVEGTLKWDAQLIASSNIDHPLPGGYLWDSAYSGTMTITANRPYITFVVHRVAVGHAGFYVGVLPALANGDGMNCFGVGWQENQSGFAKNQSRTYQVSCVWRGTIPEPIEGVVAGAYTYLQPNGQKQSNFGFCDGRLTVIK